MQKQPGAVKHTSAKINIKLVEAKCGLARKCSAQGGSRVHNFVFMGPSGYIQKRLMFGVLRKRGQRYRPEVGEGNSSQYKSGTNSCLPLLGNKRLNLLGTLISLGLGKPLYLRKEQDYILV